MAVLHRDIKPGNVLWNGEKPLLADFALSKIKDQLAGATDATVAGMASAPWAPPDLASRGSTRFDVYSLAATLLQCVTGWELMDYPDIGRALDEADLPPPVLSLLRRALDPDPANRSADGQVFDLELQAIQAARSSNWHDQKVLSFELSGAARRSLEAAGDGRSAEAVIAGRLGSATHVLPRLKTTGGGRAALTAEEFRLVGDQVELVLVFKNGHQLLCTRAEIKDYEELERWRQDEDAVTLDERDFAWSALTDVTAHCWQLDEQPNPLVGVGLTFTTGVEQECHLLDLGQARVLQHVLRRLLELARSLPGASIPSDRHRRRGPHRRSRRAGTVTSPGPACYPLSGLLRRLATATAGHDGGGLLGGGLGEFR
jgi:hypothetical protein